MDKRTCTRCGQEKPISEFYPRYTGNGNIGMSRCKKCFIELIHEKAKRKGREDVRVRPQEAPAYDRRDRR